MSPLIKQYKLKPNVTKEDLLKAGFKNNGWQSQFKEPKVSYSTELINDEIALNIEIETDTIKFDCYDNILILDKNFGQPYGAFYGNSEFEYLNRVIKNDNIKMEKLVKKGIFEEVNNVQLGIMQTN